MENQICKAINNRLLVEFDYNHVHRVVEPFTLGLSYKDKEVLSGYQVEGSSSRIDNSDWRLFEVRKIENFELLDDKFSENRVDYRRNDSRMSRIYCQV